MKVVSILSAALLATSVAATPMSITAASALASAQQVAQVVEAEPTGHVLQRRGDGIRVQNPPAGKDLGDYIRELLSQNGRKAEEATAALLVDRKDFALREKVLAELIKPLKADRQAKLDRWLEDLRKEYADKLRECPYGGCGTNKCWYPKGGDREKALLDISCIGDRNFARLTVMRSDIDTIEQEIKERVALVEKLPVVPSMRLSGDWSCTGTRKGLAGCPSITVSPVTTTMTWSIVKDFFGIQGMAKRTTLVLTTFEDVETMHAEYPLVTGLSENGPDVDQVADNASTYRYVGGCAMCH